MAEKATKIEIEVDLQCHRCYKKIKKILCEIPYVKDPIFDEKKNTVTVTVVGCDPEKVREKICCKGRHFILGIKIIPPPPKEKPKPKKEDKSTQTKEPCPTPVLGYPLGRGMGWVYVCPPCQSRGCGWSCTCNCHRWRPPMCKDGCGRPAHECICWKPPMCKDGCGRPAHECRCWKPPMCPDGCGRPVHDCSCWKPPMCKDGCGRPAHQCRCWRPPVCPGGCGRPAHECRCWIPSYSKWWDRCNYGSTSSSWPPHSCDYGRPLVCMYPGYECESSCSLM